MKPSEITGQVRRFGRGLRRHFTVGIWARHDASVPRPQRMINAFSRLIYLTAHGFGDKNLSLRASALTYLTLLSLVPTLALAFSVSKAFGLQNTVRVQIIDKLAAGQQEIITHLIDYIDRTDVKALGSIGMVILLYTVISALGRIENSFNEIWGVSEGRPFHRKFSDYISVLLIAPILIIAATGFNATLTSNRLVGAMLQYSVVSGALKLLLRLTPLFAIWIAFTFVYIFLPNTKVRFHAGAVAGISAGTMWHIAQWIYIQLQFGVAKYNAIYGTFASLPIFMVWLYNSWIIVLLGCDIAFAVQHQKTYHPPLPDGYLSIARREQVAILTLIEVVRRFRGGQPPPTEGHLCSIAGIPQKALSLIIDQLIRAGLIIRAGDQEAGLLPARDFSNHGVNDLLQAFRHQGIKRFSEDEDGELDEVVRLHHRLESDWIAAANDPVLSLTTPLEPGEGEAHDGEGSLSS